MNRSIFIVFLTTMSVFAAACHPEPALPANPRARQNQLSERILIEATRAKIKYPDEVGLILEHIVVPNQSPRLRLLATNADPRIAKGAATALIRIRMLREGDANKAIEECLATESNDVVKEACLVQKNLQKKEFPTYPNIVPQLNSTDVNVKLKALKIMLLMPQQEPPAFEGLENALVHLLLDGDERVRLLTSTVWLRRSLQSDPVKADPFEPEE